MMGMQRSQAITAFKVTEVKMVLTVTKSDHDL
jgi:hypothetical protein